MNKDQFKLQVYNNRYVRGVIVSICKIIIWSLIYLLILSLAVSAFSAEISPTHLNSYSSSPFNPGTIFAALVIIATTAVYYWAVISEIVHKIKQNKQLTQFEDDYLNGSSKSIKE